MPVPRLTVVVNFYNMRREAARTLRSLTPGYQRGVSAEHYEVIAVDNGSTEPLDLAEVTRFGPNFRHVTFSPDAPSPAAALNHGVELARGEQVMLVIDGARILSPGILSYTDVAFRAFDNPFVYTLSMHLGHQVQNESIVTGYNRHVEDRLLESVAWTENGYRLYEIATVGRSSKEGFFSSLAESNCVALTKTQYQRLGGYDERFRSRGGGLVNLDFFNRALLDPTVEPVMLLGEATFHQVHGGVATNVAMADHPWAAFAAEYEAITGHPYETVTRRPHYLGALPEECALEAPCFRP
jgi:glycosyltransferase involved in cell wall biosynthesis